MFFYNIPISRQDDARACAAGGISLETLCRYAHNGGANFFDHAGHVLDHQRRILLRPLFLRLGLHGQSKILPFRRRVLLRLKSRALIRLALLRLILRYRHKV